MKNNNKSAHSPQHDNSALLHGCQLERHACCTAPRTGAAMILNKLYLSMKRKTKSGWAREFSRESEKMKVGKEKNEKKKNSLEKKNF